jgi:hypothetical protein
LTEHELIARAEDLVQAFNHRDLDRVVAAFSPDVCFRDPSYRGSETGRQAVRADAESWLRAIPDLVVESRRTIVDGHVVAQQWTAHGTLREISAAADEPVAQRIEQDGVTIADYDMAGRIVRFVRYRTAVGPIVPDRTEPPRSPRQARPSP